MVRRDVVRRAAPVAAPLNPASGQHRVTRLAVERFRSVLNLQLALGPVCALVGEASAGKSNVLAAIRAALDARTPLTAADVAAGAERLSVEATLADGRTVAVEGAPPVVERSGEHAPPVLFVSAVARSGTLLTGAAPTDAAGAYAHDLFRRAVGEHDGAGSSAVPALSLVRAVERACAFGVSGIVLLIEEPELYLRPQAQRYLYRLLRDLADAGNQVVYSTHSPAFLNVTRLHELAFVERTASGTGVIQPEPVVPDGDTRALTEFDAERSELFLARAAVLVEGATEKLALPFVFRALGHDADREAISIVECGGKSGIPFFARVCRAVGVPYVAVHDRDAEPGRHPIQAERVLNELIAEHAEPASVVELAPDFEAVAGLRGKSHKPDRAARRFAGLTAGEMPEALVRVVRRAVELARS